MTDSSANPRNYGERPLHEDDPLMELSRIMDFGTPADDNVAWNERRPTHFEDNRQIPASIPRWIWSASCSVTSMIILSLRTSRSSKQRPRAMIPTRRAKR